MDCEQVRDQFLVLAVTGEEGWRTEGFARHLEGCERCREEWDGLAETWALR